MFVLDLFGNHVAGFLMTRLICLTPGTVIIAAYNTLFTRQVSSPLNHQYFIILIRADLHVEGGRGGGGSLEPSSGTRISLLNSWGNLGTRGPWTTKLT